MSDNIQVFCIFLENISPSRNGSKMCGLGNLLRHLATLLGAAPGGPDQTFISSGLHTLVIEIGKDQQFGVGNTQSRTTDSYSAIILVLG